MNKYVVTGINKLSGEREAVTKPHGLTKTREMRDKLAARQHCRSAYRWLKNRTGREGGQSMVSKNETGGGVKPPP